MYPAVGDTLTVRSTHVAKPRRDGEVLEVHGQDGAPPYLVQWSDDGHKGLFFPDPDTVITHHG